MKNQYSIVEAKNNFTRLLRKVEETPAPISITRRGKSVAVIMSVDSYSRLQANAPAPDFWEALQQFRLKWGGELDAMDDIWADTRDRSTGREASVWL